MTNEQIAIAGISHIGHLYATTGTTPPDRAITQAHVIGKARITVTVALDQGEMKIDKTVLDKINAFAKDRPPAYHLSPMHKLILAELDSKIARSAPCIFVRLKNKKLTKAKAMHGSFKSLCADLVEWKLATNEGDGYLLAMVPDLDTDPSRTHTGP